MNNEEKLNYLVDAFCKDSEDYKNLKVPKGEEREILRSLMNIRSPKPMSDEILKIQDEFLKEELEEKGIVYLEDIPTIKEKYNSNIKFGDKISIWQGDITRLAVDAIVNEADSLMLGCFIPCHDCVDNAIHSAAGIQLRNECSKIMKEKRKIHGITYIEPPGTAIITNSYNLPCKKIIHTVGPMVTKYLTHELINDLKNCYKSSLQCLVENNYRSISFCCIATGEFGFCNYTASEIDMETVQEFLEFHGNKIDRVVFNVSKNKDRKIYERLC